MDWETIFTNDVTDKRFISKICKRFIQLNIKKNEQPNQKIGRRSNRYFSKEEIQTANRHMKRCSASLIIRETQIKTIPPHIGQNGHH